MKPSLKRTNDAMKRIRGLFDAKSKECDVKGLEFVITDGVHPSYRPPNRIIVPYDYALLPEEMWGYVEGVIDHEMLHAIRDRDAPDARGYAAAMDYINDDQKRRRLGVSDEHAQGFGLLMNFIEDGSIEHQAGEFDNDLFIRLAEKNRHAVVGMGFIETATPLDKFGLALRYLITYDEDVIGLCDDLGDLIDEVGERHYEAIYDARESPDPVTAVSIAVQVYKSLLEETKAPPEERPKHYSPSDVLEAMRMPVSGGIHSYEDEMAAEIATLIPERAGSGEIHPHPQAVAMDKVTKPVPPAGKFAKLWEEARPYAGVMGTKLVMLLKARRPTVRYEQEEGELDDDMLVEAYMGQREVYTNTLPAPKLSTAWSVLIDQSGSMRGHKIDTARVASLSLGETLNRCGIPFEMFGWTTDQQMVPASRRSSGKYTRYGAQSYFQYKAFDEPWPRVRQRTSAIQAVANNDDAEAVLFAAKRLLQRKEHHKVLLVMSDGQPAYYTPSGVSPSEQLREALATVKAAGIRTIGVGILSHHVEDYYDDCIVVDDLERWTPQLIEKVRSIVLG